MLPANYKLRQLIVPVTTPTAGSTANTGYVDCAGYSYLSIDVVEMSASAATQVDTLSIREDDTVPTAFTDMSAIVALTGAAATSTSAGFVLPTPNSAVENNYRFKIDLKGRKRYVGINFTPGVTTRVACNAYLWRGNEGANQATSTDATATVTTASLRLNLAV